ncbi:uncharacterized protein LOC111624432 isoform X2 [Centruroides sculpturatus]|uniref:uncharacterized protein LOC111624432 isoform X2 n=1 Tax=Centruroides sculpturatus TaxID=218467 RepID=UPI000C6CF063|nr:uncharacterized protein LOC111624432 isoform X2 [Centruroides sculpturatus]
MFSNFFFLFTFFLSLNSNRRRPMILMENSLTSILCPSHGHSSEEPNQHLNLTRDKNLIIRARDRDLVFLAEENCKLTAEKHRLQRELELRTKNPNSFCSKCQWTTRYTPFRISNKTESKSRYHRVNSGGGGGGGGGRRGGKDQQVLEIEMKESKEEWKWTDDKEVSKKDQCHPHRIACGETEYSNTSLLFQNKHHCQKNKYSAFKKTVNKTTIQFLKVKILL